METKINNLEDLIVNLENQLNNLEMENKLLRNLIIEREHKNLMMKLNYYVKRLD